jgi:hypothetical protein
LAVLWGVSSPSSTIPDAPAAGYVPRGPNILAHIFRDYFQDFARFYDSLYAKDYGKFRACAVRGWAHCCG